VREHAFAGCRFLSGWGLLPGGLVWCVAGWGVEAGDGEELCPRRALTAARVADQERGVGGAHSRRLVAGDCVLRADRAERFLHVRCERLAMARTSRSCRHQLRTAAGAGAAGRTGLRVLASPEVPSGQG
jgi:hypothetical protein